LSQTDVINAFLDGQCTAEPPLSTDGSRLYFDDDMIARNGDGKLSAAAEETGCTEDNLRELLIAFVEWRKRRERLLRSIVEGMQARIGPRKLTGGGYPVRCQGPTQSREAS